ncbi:MAG TPA: nitrogen fixation protein NifZ [Methylophilus sp.]
MLAGAGTRGEVVNVGVIEESGQPVYLVEFADGKVIGVLEEELAPV